MNLTVGSQRSADAKRALLEQRLRALSTQSGRVPLSFSQQRLWFLDQLQPNSSLYNVASVGRILGPLNVHYLEQAISTIVQRHESLRTRFDGTDGLPVQIIDEDASVTVDVRDLSHFEEDQREKELKAIIACEVHRPFNLAEDRLLRVFVVREREQQHVLILVMHHIISDEWSLKVFFNELASSYTSLVRGDPVTLSSLPIQYNDFAAWQRKWMRGEILEKQLSFWKSQLGGNLPLTELPTDRPRKSLPEFIGNCVSRTLSQETSVAVRNLADEEKASLFMVLLAGFKALTARYTQQSDIIIGSPVAGRSRLETEGLIGFFVNTLPLRTNLGGNPSFRECVKRVRQMTLEAFKHQDLPFDRLVEELRPERSLTHMPFTRLMFTLQAGVMEDMQLDGARLHFEDVETHTSKFDLTIVAQETSRGLVIKAEFDTALFDKSTIERLLEGYEILLYAGASSPGTLLGDLPVMGTSDISLVVKKWSGVGCPDAPTKCIHQLFEVEAEKNPRATAIIFGERRLTYAELNSRANQVAHHLRGLGVRQDVPVAICTRRSIELIVGVLGILKSGGAYVPLDPSYPRERLEFMLSDTRAPVLLSEQCLIGDLPKCSAKVVCLDSDWELLAREPRQNPVNISTPDSLAYIMYTSGSTGIPKGVCVPHQAVCRLVLNSNYIQLTPLDRVAQVSNASFDAATFEIWGALLNGAQLIKIGKDLALSPPEFALELRRRRISALFLTTALFNQLAYDAPHALATVKTVMFGGEAADPKSIRAIIQGGKPQRLINVYGPTENTTFSTWHEIVDLGPEVTSIPIGIPITNTQAYILDENLHPVPIGVPAELFLAGPGLARGYWDREDMTRACFVTTTIHRDSAPVRLYRTGDLVRWLPSGIIEFVGRKDNQVKIRGFRVEPGEVESLLAQHPGVRECAVTLHGSNSATRRLVAYTVPAAGVSINASDLRNFLSEKLPDYMVPSAFITLDALPLTPNGKVDRKSLPAPDQARPDLEGGYTPPRDIIERKLAKIWEAVLNVKPIGVHDKFFELGGHSLLAVRLVANIERVFGRKLRLATIFQAPTIAQLAAVLREDVRESSLSSKTSLVEIQAQGSRPPLFLVHGAGGGMFWGYVNLARHLGTDQPVYGFRSRGLDGLAEFNTIEALAAQYVKDLREFQPRGPYYLGGYCFGGNVAFEMAHQLKSAGEEVAVLALINAAPANSKYLEIPWTPIWAARFAGNLVYWAKYFLSWSRPQRHEFFAWKWSVLKRRVLGLVRRTRPGTAQTYPGVDAGNLVDLSSYSADQRKVWETHIQALLNYHPKPYPGSVHLFRSGGHPLWCSFQPDYGWGEFVSGGVEVVKVPGAHEKVLEDACAAKLAAQLQSVLNRSQSERSATLGLTAAAAIGGVAMAGVACLGAELLESIWQGLAVLGGSITGGNVTRRRMQKGSASTLPESDLNKFRGWNRTQAKFDLTHSYITHFRRQATRTPDAPALRYRDETLSYGQLDERSGQLASRLVQAGVGRGTLVAFCLNRSADIVVSMLAIWKCGAAYLPLDPGYPKDRLDYMLQDSGARVLVMHNGFADHFDTTGLQTIVLDRPEEQALISKLPKHLEAHDFPASSLAYVIYTSGSTGKPKGVEILHRSLLNHNFGISDIYKLTAEDRVIQFSPVSFDISVEEIFPTLLNGGLLIVRTEEVISSVSQFLKFVTEERITVLNLPTAYWHEIVEHLRETSLPESVRLVVIGGEKASDEAFKQWKQRVDQKKVAFINTYGPTETTVTASYYIANGEVSSLAIGKPLPNIQFAVLDEHMRRVRPGETGELYIGGAALARGYLARPELTAERFVENPFEDIDSDRLYRTGDLVRFRPDGNLDFIGRADQQVKIRGFRIELGEIENTLQSHPGIKDSVVLAREVRPGHKKLVAYVVPRNGEQPHVTEMLKHVRERLPAYMVPASFVSMENFPLTPAGKIDRLALPAPGARRPDLDQKYVAPRTPAEAMLASLYSEVLEIDRVGVLDNFFDLGGHSLVATQVIARVRETLRITISLADIFSLPSVGALAERIEEVSKGRLRFQPALVPGIRSAELTPAQERIWFLDQFDPTLSPYNLAVGIRLTGPLNLAALEKALAQLAEKHEFLRSFYPEQEEKPVCFILPPGPVAMKVLDICEGSEEQRNAKSRAFAAEEMAKSFLTFRPVFYPALLKLSPTTHDLYIGFHEIAVDHGTAQYLIQELVGLYESEVSGTPVNTTVQAHEEKAIVSENFEQCESFWRDKLKGQPHLLDLPKDRPRPSHKSDAGSYFSVNLPRSIVRHLRDKNSAEATLLAAFQVLLARYTGSRDIVIGTPVSRRSSESPMTFEDYLVLRQELSEASSFAEVQRQARDTLDEAFAHDLTSFDRVVEIVEPPRNSSYTPIFQVLFRFDHAPGLHTCAAGVSFEQFECPSGTSKFDLSVRVRKEGADCLLSFRYSTALFDEERIRNMARHFCTLLRAGLECPEKPITKLPLMDEEESEQVLAVWNRTERPYAFRKTLIQLFEEQARRSPRDIALVFGQQKLTYQELLDNSARVAKELRALGVGTGGKVALCMERSPELVSAILGTLRTGAAYLPVDPHYPHDRVEFMLNDAEVSAVISQRKFQHLFAGTPGTPVWIEDLDWHVPVPQIPASNASPEDVAYIIYTSGSTGKPKGVLIENRNSVAFMHWARDTFDAEELSGVLASTSICFDLSIFELFAPLCWGGRVILAENALSLPALPCAGEVRLVNTVPSAIRELIRIKGIPDSVRTVNLAGEPLAQSLVDEIYGSTSVKRVMDLYGPTETTTYSTGGVRVRGGTATIGRPLANEQVYLFDASMEPVPVGIPGELYIGGAGVARGYLNRPELTSEKFIDNPLQPGDRLYRTGDLARWRFDGNLEYLGRIDHQVKIRGFRIEPGEIEAALRKHPKVKDAIVLVREDSSGEKTLAAYVVGDPLQLSTNALQSHLAPQVPQYMVPSAFVVLESFPLTPNGKIDRKALPSPEMRRDEGVKFLPARNELESRLVAIWKSVLSVDEIGVTDNFFQLGGHSLLAIRIVARIREALNIQLPLFSIFEWPTIETLAKQINTGEWALSEGAQPPLQPVKRDTAPPASFVQERLWFLDQLNPGSDAYNVPAALRMKGALDVQRLETALNKVVARHETLRTTLQLKDSGLVQDIAPSLRIALPVIEISEGGLVEELSKSAGRPFDLGKGPLLRAELFRMSPEEHVLLVTMHHAISDGWSLTILFRDLETYYSETEDPTDLPIQYADYAHWQQQVMAGPTLKQELAFWKETLRGAPAAIRFPDSSGSPARSQKVARASMEFSADLLAGMSHVGQEMGTTPFRLLMAGLAITLAKWTGQHDLVIGTVVAGRGRRELENLIGCFMNFLPIRLKVPKDGTGSDCIAHVKEVMLQAQAHEDCPFEKIVGEINPTRTKDTNPLYNVALLWQNFPHDLFNGEGLETTSVPVFNSSALLDLRFEAEQQGPNVSLICEYREGQFKPESIAALLENLRMVVEGLATAPSKRIAELASTTVVQDTSSPATQPETKRQIAIAGTFTTEPLADSLAYWAGELGLDVAPTFASYNQVFQELLDPSSLLGGNKDGLNVTLIRFEDWIRKDGSASDSTAKADIVRNIQEFVGALKTFALRNNAPHIVCLCPASPKRAQDPSWMGFLQDQEEHLRDQLQAIPGVQLLGHGEILKWYPVEDYYDAASDELGHVPYTPVFYTAIGSAIMRKFQALKRPPSKVIVLDCDNTLWCGVCGEEGARGIRLDQPWKALQEFVLAQHEAGMLLALCSKNNPEDVEEVFAKNSHFPLNRSHFAAVRLNWQPKSENLRAIARELNLGLESFIFIDDNPVECAEVEANCPEVVTLLLPEAPGDFSRFLAHSWVFDHQKLTAEDRLRAESYRQNRERELLRSKSSGLAEFIASLDLKIQIEQMNSGSLARAAQLTQRTNQFNLTTRRRTEQELSALHDHTILTVRVSDRFGDYGIVGLLIFQKKDETLDIDTFLLSCRVLGRGVEHAMLSHLGRIARESHLPTVNLHFMPSAKNKPALSFLENVAAEFRQPGSGKLLFRMPAGIAQEVAFNPAGVAQLEPDPANNGKPASQEPSAGNYAKPPYRTIATSCNSIEAIHNRIESALARSTSHPRGPSPETELQKTIADVWSSLLRRQDISVTDSFFDLGGHSLMAVRLFAELERLTGQKLPLVTLFQAPTIRELANVLQQARTDTHKGPSLLVPVQPLGDLPPLFLIHGAGGDVLWGYANLAAHLPTDRPVYGIKSRGQVGLDECKTIHEMAAHYVEAIQTRQSHGPYYLGGYCFGGNVAYEMARILRAKGESVELVALLDSSPSNAGYEDVRWWTPTFAWRFARNTMYWLNDFRQMPWTEQTRFVTRKARVFMRKIRDSFRKEKRAEGFDLEQIIDLGHFPEHELKLWQTHIQALVEHVEMPYDGRVVLFRTRGQPVLCSFEEDFCWGGLARGGVQIVRVPGSHENIFMEPNVKVLARELARHLPPAEQPVAESEAIAA